MNDKKLTIWLDEDVLAVLDLLKDYRGTTKRAVLTEMITDYVGGIEEEVKAAREFAAKRDARMGGD